MNRTSLLAASYLIDRVAGDPEWFPHPVRGIGIAIARGEKALRHDGQSSRSELIAGAGLVLATVGGAYLLSNGALRWTYRRSKGLAIVLECLLAWTCLAARNLEQEADAVLVALERGDLEHARRRLSRIVGRDTAALSPDKISRAVIETLAESLSDGVLAPMFYLAVGGVPLAMAYKAVNTLDSMIGHADDRYFYFGKVAARLDDVANFIPARLSALSLVGASCLTDGTSPTSGWRIWLRDGSNHKSPNAGQPESAMAGALQISLGGDNTYAGEVIRGQRMGEEFPPSTPASVSQAIRLVSIATVLTVSLFGLMTLLVSPKPRRCHD